MNVTQILMGLDPNEYKSRFYKRCGRKPGLSINETVFFISNLTPGYEDADTPTQKDVQKDVKRWLKDNESKRFLDLVSFKNMTNSGKSVTKSWYKLPANLPMSGDNPDYFIRESIGRMRPILREWKSAWNTLHEKGDGPFNCYRKKVSAIKQEISNRGLETRTHCTMPNAVVRKFDDGKFLFVFIDSAKYGHFNGDDFVVEKEF